MLKSPRPSPRQASLRTLARFAFRLLIIGAFAMLWSYEMITNTVEILCLGLAVACVVFAVADREPLIGESINHWHEAGALIAIALLIYLFSRLLAWSF